ncbi:MAG: Rne/Rng family ribonuclease [Acidobacteriota bacterium]|nr:Rne/Rng family ribonuclease [Acidobacteriota bacterium]
MAEKSSKVMLVNVTHTEESRIVILSNGVLEAFEIETVDRKSRKGNIYTGRVEAVQPGLQASFVDIGDERSAFLPLDEVNFSVLPSRKEGARGRIEHHLHRGQEVLVQIVRDAFNTKPPSLSTYYSLPGRYLVLTPGYRSSGVSRKLGDEERDRIRKLLDDLKPPEPHGIIARTAVAGATKLEMKRDMKYLLRLWEKIEQAAKKAGPAKLIYMERSMVIRAMRDLYTPDIDEILVDDEQAYQEIVDFMSLAAPTKKKVVKLYQGHRPIFNKYNLEEQIENIFRRRVPLPSGGAIIFDTTEALTSVDVNSGKMKREGHIEDTATKANIEAAQEIARQLRLRDLGGLIVIDFIDMRSQKNVRQVEKAMKDAMKGDKARYDTTRISRLGLMEISRERMSAQKLSLRYRDCPVCDGTGSIKTVEAAALQALRRLQTRIVRADLEQVEMRLPPDVAAYLQNAKRGELIAWEQRYRTRIDVIGDDSLGRDDAELKTIPRVRSDEESALVAPPTQQEILAAIEEEQEEEEEIVEDDSGEAEEEGAEGTKKKRRRRRRRRHRKPGEAAEGDPAEASEETEDTQDREFAAGDEPESAARHAEATEVEGAPRKKRRRRRRRRPGETVEGAAAEASEEIEEPQGGELAPGDADATEEEGAPRKKRRRRRRRRRREEAPEESGSETPAAAPAVAASAAPIAAAVSHPSLDEEGAMPRASWWRRLIGAEDGEDG